MEEEGLLVRKSVAGTPGAQGIVIESGGWIETSEKILPIWRKEFVSSICFTGLGTSPAISIFFIIIIRYLIFIVDSLLSDFKLSTRHIIPLYAALPPHPKVFCIYLFFTREVNLPHRRRSQWIFDGGDTKFKRWRREKNCWNLKKTTW